MRNVAFSPEYANQYKQQSEILFRPENKRTKEEGCFANGYFLLCETYEGELDGEPRMAARYSLFTPNHDLVLSYDCLDNEHALSEMIKHNNGIVYYVFRRDRFGFSVFNLATLTEHRYYSDEAFKTGSDFIWCGAEERGLLGSKAYVEAHRDELDRLRFCLNISRSITTGVPSTA